MSDALTHQLRRLDEGLLMLLSERAELLSLTEADSPRADDLLGRYEGRLSAAAVREFFTVVEGLCRQPLRRGAQR